MPIEYNFSLKELNTFGLDVKTSAFISFSDRQEFIRFIRLGMQEYPHRMMLGGGSNVLFTGDYPGLVMALRTQGISIQNIGSGSALVTAEAGENWDSLVETCIQQGLGGIENLSLIPGNAGTAPIQNIGAYGSELSDTLDHVNLVSLETGEEFVLNASECRLGYRDSIFKQELKGRVAILSITLKLSYHEPVNLSYEVLREELEKAGITNPDRKQVRDIVCQIRRDKLPDPRELGNAGSFFKNPTLNYDEYRLLLQRFPSVKVFQSGEGQYKIPAAWLIDSCGWKGVRFGNAGVHSKQALVLVNHGGATGREILDLCTKITESVWQTFGIRLETEVNIV